MCKIVIIPNASKIVDFKEFANKMADALSDQRDGFGYAAQGENGVFGSRTLSPRSFALENPPSFAVGNRVDFGQSGKVTGAAMFHGRVSTNYISIRNTHPIELDGWYLIHNGVVTDHGAKYTQKTSNDSEHVLHRLMTGGIKGVADSLTGYYAAGVIDNLGQLHIIRDSIASLYVSYSDKLETYIFATTTELIDEIGDLIKEDLTAYRMKDDMYLVFNKNELVHEANFESRGYDDYSASQSYKSLGYGLTPSWKGDDLDSDSPTDDDSFDEYMDSFDLADVSDSFWDELETMDRGYYILDREFNEVDVEKFRKMQLKEQVCCEIRRPDGTILNPFKLDKAS